jgi:hypothetical protein
MIEESGAPRGAIVKSPDRIRDLTTNELREVDASIRFQAGGVEILITVECQKRSRKANDTWIEQLATKRQKLGAAKTIAVSEKGFTRAAHLTARQHGIELRTLSEIRPQDVEGWFLQDEGVHTIPESANIRCSVRIEGCADYIEIGDAWEPLFFHDRVNSPFPALVFWHLHEMAHPRRFAKLPRDGSVSRMEFDLDATTPDFIPVPNDVLRVAASPVLIELDGHRKVITDIKISADVSLHMISIDSSNAVYHAYEGTNGPIAQHAKVKGEAFGLPVTFDLATQGSEISGIAEFPSGARLRLLGWMENVPQSVLVREACAFCDGRNEIKPRPILPDFLVPPGVKAHESFLCSNCAQRFEQLDAYGADVWHHVPEDLTGTLHGAFSFRPVDGRRVRLWLLSLLWRMGASQALSMIDLGDDEAVVRGLLNDSNPGQPEQYPVVCIALSAEGKRVPFFFPPRWDLFDGKRVLSIILQGVLFNFLVGTDTADNARLITENEWVFPILDWRKVDFLVDEVLKIGTTHPDTPEGRD